MNNTSLAHLQNALGYIFGNSALLEKALTHSSVSPENNEVLEFMGDALLQYLVSDYLRCAFPTSKEGELTERRKKIVSESPLASYFTELNLLSYVRIANVNFKTMSDHLKSSFVEALVGAVYLDGGLECAKSFVETNLCCKTDTETVIDFKSELKEYCEKNKLELSFSYEEKGPAHAKEYYAFASVDGREMGSGFGKRKKDAERIACKVALEKLKCTK